MTRPLHLARIRPGVWLALCLMCIAGVYVGALSGKFVWDDNSLLRAVKSAPSFLDSLTRPFWPADETDPGVQAYFRPIANVSLTVDYWIHGENSAGYRLTNLLLHLLNTALLFHLCKRVQPRHWATAIVTLIWAIQPRLAENVAWISGRTDVLCGTFALAALMAWGPATGRRLACGSLLFLALLAKETAIAAVVAVMVLEIGSARPVRWSSWQRLIMPASVALAYLLLRTATLGSRSIVADSLQPWDRPLTALEAVARYAWMLFDPWQPRTRIGSVGQPNHWLMVAGAAVTIAGGTCLYRFRRSISVQAWAWLALALVPIALVSHIVPVANDVVAADRFLYVPTMAIAVLVAGSRFWTWRGSAPVGFAVGLSLAPSAVRRAPDWSDPIALWTRTCETPSSRTGLSLLELGNLEFSAGNHARSLDVFAAILREPATYRPFFELTATNLSLSLVAVGRYRDAEQVMRAVVRHEPKVSKYWYDLATMQIRNGNFVGARESLSAALARTPTVDQAASVSAGLQQFENTYRLLANAQSPLAERAWVRTQLGLWHEAETDWLAALEATPEASEQALALSFIADHGSATAVERALATADRWRLRYPEIHSVLTSKLKDSKRLAAIALSAYGVAPQSGSLTELLSPWQPARE